jgi:hypothetical protein
VVNQAPTTPRSETAPDGRLTRYWNGALAVVVLAAFVTQIVLLVVDEASTTDPDASMLTRFIRFFSYFTIQSNLFVVVTAISLALVPRRDGPLWRVARLDALLGIVITGIVFELVLAKDIHLSGAAWWANVGFHYFSPWAVLVGWLLFGPRPRIDWRTFGFAFVWPVLWIVYTFVHGAISDWYPYPFLDVNLHGYGTAIRNTFLVVVMGLVIGLVLKALDRMRTIDR